MTETSQKVLDNYKYFISRIFNILESKKMVLLHCFTECSPILVSLIDLLPRAGHIFGLLFRLPWKRPLKTKRAKKEHVITTLERNAEPYINTRTPVDEIKVAMLEKNVIKIIEVTCFCLFIQISGVSKLSKICIRWETSREADPSTNRRSSVWVHHASHHQLNVGFLCHTEMY